MSPEAKKKIVHSPLTICMGRLLIFFALSMLIHNCQSTIKDLNYV